MHRRAFLKLAPSGLALAGLGLAGLVMAMAPRARLGDELAKLWQASNWDESKERLRLVMAGSHPGPPIFNEVWWPVATWKIDDMRCAEKQGGGGECLTN